jgi:hypothetical protein
MLPTVTAIRYTGESGKHRQLSSKRAARHRRTRADQAGRRPYGLAQQPALEQLGGVRLLGLERDLYHRRPCALSVSLSGLTAHRPSQLGAAERVHILRPDCSRTPVGTCHPGACFDACGGLADRNAI